MRSRTPTVLALALALVAAACSSGTGGTATTSQGAPAVRDYGPEVGSGTYAAPEYPPAAPRYEPAVAAGPLRWHTRLADAQADARATGRLILTLATKPRCGLCDKFKTQIAPATSGELGRVAVGYVYDITRPEVRQVDQTLRANLRGADLMPLVGFLTPELGWVHGFWGQRSVSQFRGDIARAASMRGMTARLDAPLRTVPAPRTAMVVNEFGEREWARPTDVWPETDPEPVDAITGEPGPDRGNPAVAAGPGAPVLADATLPATATPAPPSEVPAAAGVGGLPALEPAAPTATVEPTPTVETPRAEVATTGTFVRRPPPPSLSDLGAVAEAPRQPAAEPARPAQPAYDDAWGRDTLEKARGLIADGRFDEARRLIEEVSTRMEGSDLSRTAAKGAIALYNAKRIRLATTGAERDQYLTRARRDLGRSMWGELFGS